MNRTKLENEVLKGTPGAIDALIALNSLLSARVRIQVPR